MKIPDILKDFNLNKQRLEQFDKDGDEIDDEQGKLQVGHLVYSKADEFFMVILGRSGLMDTMEIPSRRVHEDLGGYCYNNNIIRVPITEAQREYLLVWIKEEER